VEPVYTAQARSSGDARNGRVDSSDGQLSHQVAFPPQMGGSGEGTNPEQLFAAGYAACFHQALKLAASKEQIKVPDSSVDVAVGIGPDETSFALAVALTVYAPGLDQATADRLAEAAHQLCPYSKATRGNIPVQVTAVV
jgi:lipoyl-dependent peroxiredoxin